MKLSILAERFLGEHRVAQTPVVVAKLVKLGIDVLVEGGAGARARIEDGLYAARGARVVGRGEALSQADVVLTVRPPEASEIKRIRAGARLMGGLAPYADPQRLAAYASLGIDAMALELLTRTTRAQAMDILSRRASGDRYRAILLASFELNRCLPMMTTAAGTIPAAKLFVMGVGVARLQAVATGRRLGAIASAREPSGGGRHYNRSKGDWSSQRLPPPPEGAPRRKTPGIRARRFDLRACSHRCQRGRLRAIGPELPDRFVISTDTPKGHYGFIKFTDLTHGPATYSSTWES